MEAWPIFGAWPGDDSAAPPRHLILTRGAAGVRAAPSRTGFSRALRPPSEPPSRHLGYQGAEYHRQRRSAPGSSAPLCEVGWPHTYFSHKDEGLARRPPAGRKRRQPDPGESCAWPAARGPSGAGGWRGAWWPPALPGEVEGAGPGRRPRWRGAGAEGTLGGGGSRLLLGSLLHPRRCRPRPRDPGCSGCAAQGQMPALPAPAAGWGQLPDASPCPADKGGVALL